MLIAGNGKTRAGWEKRSEEMEKTRTGKDKKRL